MSNETVVINKGVLLAAILRMATLACAGAFCVEMLSFLLLVPIENNERSIPIAST